MRKKPALMTATLCILLLCGFLVESSDSKRIEDLFSVRKPAKHSYNRKLAHPTSTDRVPFVLGYYTDYYGNDDRSYRDLAQNDAQFSAIATVYDTFNTNAQLAGTIPARGVQFARDHHIDRYLVVSNQVNDDFNRDLAHTVLNDSSKQTQLISNILKTLQIDGYNGANIDFEDLLPSDRIPFTSFITALSNTLHQNHMKLVVSVAAKTSDSAKSPWIGAYDYAKLGHAADFLGLMAYDENGPWDHPGPVAGYDWVKSVVQYAVSQVSPNRLLLGLPAYGYDWDLANPKQDKAVAWSQTSALINLTHAKTGWDGLVQSPYMSFKDSHGDNHTVWYENEQSIKSKLGLVHQYGLGGVTVWRMGLEDAAFWDVVRAAKPYGIP